MNHPLRRLLIANRGEIACRIIESARSLDIQTIAVHHRLDHRARHVTMADTAQLIEGETPVAAHLDGAQLIAVAQRTGCDAVHPGYGFLSENAGFAGDVQAAGLTFVGPRADTIRLMGDKIEARGFAVRHGVPVSPSVTPTQDMAQFVAQAAAIGFPLLIKAAAGGGGKGMSIARTPAELAAGAVLAASEAQRYFGDSRVYAERFIERPRHIEVQVVGDGGGRVIHLGERECSIQRRFQKVIEEAPAVGLAEDLRQSIIEAAVKLASAAHYTNAGTVEFIVAPDGRFYFLEMNTRLQVEHRVTERVCNLDLVALQLALAAGQALPEQDSIVLSGHAIECRICAEDPERNFMPETGRVLRAVAPQQSWAQVDSGLMDGQTVGTSFDPMLAKLIVAGASRQEAIERMSQALQDTAILGVGTNLDLLGRVMTHPAFVAGRLHTGFLSEHGSELRAPTLADEERSAVLLAAAMASPPLRRLIDDVTEPYARLGGWRN
jgi:propionyl-CoA carboxylase alpha chain/3-methylcrotonyl-CoA carboxylase alpha subunit/acetyl-CoA/propionyl-CoA carboxylase biotin carboxyl carrier protein